MTAGPTRGASDDRAWVSSRGRAWLVRAGVFLFPIVASFAVTRFVGGALWYPAGSFGPVVFIAQIGVVGSAAALLSERAVRRLLPLVELLNMTLVFPDRAPSRFGLALRSGSLSRLRASLDGGLADDHQAAAEQLVEMVTALGQHERLTRGHTDRVRAYCDVIGQQLGLSPDDRQKLAWAAMAHDVGKLRVPADILALRSQPDDAQWTLLKHHPVAGGELVESLAGWLGPWRLAASQHHERWDGEGYPHGLAGTDIGLAGRIVAVADAFDVITSSRSYKKAQSHEAARAEMVRCSGSQFDPDVVQALLKASLGRPTTRFGFLGWLSEAGGLSALPRGVGQAASLVATAAAVTVVAVTGTPGPPDEDAAPVPIVAPAHELAFADDGTPPEATAGTTRRAPDATSTGRSSTTVGSTTTTSELGPSSTESSVNTTTTAGPGTSGPTTTAVSTTTTTAPTTTTTAPTTTTTAPTTTTTLVPMTDSWDIGAGGHTTSQAILPLDGPLQGGALPNYDTDRDGDAGLYVQKGNGLTETDGAKIQRWAASVDDARLVGATQLEIWAATKDFDTGKAGRFVVGLYDCDAAHGSCTLLASADGSFNQATFGGDFGLVAVALGAIDHTFGPNRTLVMVVAPRNASDDDLWFAYGTTTYPTRLSIS